MDEQTFDLLTEVGGSVWRAVVLGLLWCLVGFAAGIVAAPAVSRVARKLRGATVSRAAAPAAPAAPAPPALVHMGGVRDRVYRAGRDVPPPGAGPAGRAAPDVRWTWNEPTARLRSVDRGAAGGAR